MMPASITGSAEVRAFLDGLPPTQAAVVGALRAVVLEAAPDAEESMMRGQPAYRIGGARFCYIGAFKKHVNIGFWRGASLAKKAPGKRLLEGSGKGMRHVKLEALLDVPTEEIRALVSQAAKLELGA